MCSHLLPSALVLWLSKTEGEFYMFISTWEETYLILYLEKALKIIQYSLLFYREEIHSAKNLSKVNLLENWHSNSKSSDPGSIAHSVSCWKTLVYVKLVCFFIVWWHMIVQMWATKMFIYLQVHGKAISIHLFKKILLQIKSY